MKIEDIARLAGVSKGAVSLALNGKKGISEEKRQKILALAQEYNYQPLRKRRTEPALPAPEQKHLIRFVACSAPPLFSGDVHSLPYFSELLSGLSTIAQDLPLSLLINSFSYQSILQEFQEAEQFQPSDGVILLGTGLADETIQQIIQAHPNVVVVDSSVPYLDANFVSMNNYQGAFLATEYLVLAGHRKIGYALGDVRLHNFEERKRGFTDALKKHSIPIQNKFFIEFPTTTINSLPDKITLPDLPSAFFCENDTVAISLIKSLQSKGISIPEDVSIIGFDNIAESRVLTPELTTVDVNRSELVKQALRKLLRVISEPNRSATSQTLINTHIIERNSVKNIKRKTP